ncbi:PLDc N-terminal domain-containing protein [Myroides guanonis]|uniref:PLDc N-terminal domain-containing protein n=1 Tax=Myroides guanonis TaxID=1150112 RepID=UPI000B820B93|nr:PLDc N-terminal domain-containing protein [Myroides guanonis]
MSYFLFFWQFFLLFLLILIPYSLFKLGYSNLDNNQKLIWCLIILLIPFFGGLAYLLVMRNKKIIK